MVRNRLIGAAVLLATAVAITPAMAAPPRTTVTGTVRDPLGNGQVACVQAEHRPGVPPVSVFLQDLIEPDARTVSASDGSFTLDLLPGEHLVRVWEPTIAGGVADCGLIIWPGKFEPDWTTTIFVGATPATVELEVPFAALYGANDVVLPGGDLAPTVGIHVDAGTDVRAWFRDETSGATVRLPHWVPASEDAWNRHSAYRRFFTDVAVLAPAVDGTYPYSLWVEDASGRRITNLQRSTYAVDSIAPVIQSTWPADGDTIEAGNHFISMRATDANAMSGRARIFDRSSGEPVQIIDTSMTRSGTNEYRTPVFFEPNTPYRIEFRARDGAGNLRTRTVDLVTAA